MGKNISDKKQGFTLIELLLYLGIFIIIITTLSSFAITFIKAVHKSQIKKEVSLGAYSAMKTIIYEIKTAKNIYNPTSIFDFNPGQLSIETTNNLPTGEQITYIDFYIDDDDRLYLKRENQESQVLISEDLRIDNLQFEYIASSPESIRISITVAYDTNNPEYQYSYNLNSAASIRK